MLAPLQGQQDAVRRADGISGLRDRGIFDGYLLAHSPHRHSVNYCTVMAFGRAQAVGTHFTKCMEAL